MVNSTEKSDEREHMLLKASLQENIARIQSDFNNSMDLLIRTVEINGIKMALIMCEGMINLQSFSELIIEPLLKIKKEEVFTEQSLYDVLTKKNVLSADVASPQTYEDLYKFIMSGFVVILIDKIDKGVSCGLQGFSVRSISEPETQINIRGSKEGFVEALRINLTMVRRRLKTPNLNFELMTIGEISRTDVALVYMKNIVSDELLNEIRRRLKNIKLKIILESGYIQPFLEKKPQSFFSGIGTTERPDSLCAKITEGRVGILVDGTPFALVAPYLFVENFQTMDDYTARPYFATFIRILKYISFFMSMLLPGVYVAVVSYHPELLPPSLLYIIAVSESTTPFPLVYEALIIHFVFEMMREAGLRLPRAVGHAVSIVGALVIGETAVAAGLIGTPMVLIVALTAISSFVIPAIYDAVSMLRISFIILGGFFGILGITLALAVVGVNMCGINPLGIPFTSPITPFCAKSMRDVFYRASWKNLQKDEMKIQNLAGSELTKKKRK